MTDIFHGQKCTNLFDIIKKFFNDIKKYAKIEDTLNEINSITNHEIIGSNLKKFNIEEYFALKKISNKFANPQELLFIIDFFSKKYDLLNSNSFYKKTYIDKVLDRLFNWLYKNRDDITENTIELLSNSRLYRELLKWGENDQNIMRWLGRII